MISVNLNPIKWFSSEEKSFNSYVPTTPGNGGWFPFIIHEPFSGAWQKNISWKRKDVTAHFAVFACISLIASDISKLAINLVREDSKGIWNKIPMKGYEVLNTPNHYQNRIQFIETWLISKLSRGNTYVLKERDRYGKVVKLYILNPDFVTPLVSDTGDIFYQLSQDNLTGITETDVTVPQSEIIHDRFNCLYHPLVGLSPIFACGLAAMNGLNIQKNSSLHFANMSRPGGLITVPGGINEENAKEIKTAFEQNYSGDNVGKIAVLGDDMKYTAMNYVSASDSQIVEQMKLNADIVCSTFHVPPYKVIGNAPTYNNIEALEQAYYSQALQVLIESIELLLDEGLEIPEKTGTEFDLDGLLRMDSKTHIETLGLGVQRAIYAPNEARKRLNMTPVDGGDVPYLQEQNWPINQLSERSPDKIGEASGSKSSQNGNNNIEPAEEVEDNEKQMLHFGMLLRKELKEVEYDA